VLSKVRYAFVENQNKERELGKGRKNEREMILVSQLKR